MGRQAGQTGWVRWPVDSSRFTDGGEGGMWVHAFWLADFSTVETVYRYAVPPGDELAGVTDEVQRDPFIRCHGPENTICLPLPDCPVSDSTPQVYHDRDDLDRDKDPEGYTIGVYDAGYPVLAAICLGTSGVSYNDVESGSPWQCTPDDLTAKGLGLLAGISQLYGRQPVLVTYLDT